MLNTRFSPWPRYSAAEQAAVQRCLKSGRVNYWTGVEGQKFEQEFARFAGSRHAVALANGTVALELALRLLEIGPGDDVVVTPRTFLASASSIVLAGARPVFADVDPDSQNVTAATIEAVLTRRTRAILCVHLAGWPCEMDEINALARRHGAHVIEDCAQAHGARYRGRPVGALGRVGAWSFCQDKIITTGGEGGMLTVNDPQLWRQAWAFKDHGKSWDAVHRRHASAGYRWLHESFGTNWRMTEMQAAIGRIQLGRLAQWRAARASNAARILAACASFEALRAPVPPAHVRHAWYKCYAFVRPERLRRGWNRDRIVGAIAAAGVPCFTGSCPEVYLEKAFETTKFRPKRRLPVARELGETSLMFLVHPGLARAQIDKTCDVITRVMQEATSASRPRRRG
jgi:dTDP-4-amino-4,6-dideoxygalactose transaminase